LKDKETPTPASVTTTTQRRVTNKITNRYYGECGYFDQLTDADPFVFDRFRDKIKYFHPAFHSTTPEGLNARLTFLLQCTRQGKTLESQGANNLAFGRPPVCILRIGDFYNTKIVMDSVNIDYEPLVWDLNPEGVGVQPMIANVSISFKFIGASTLMGPLNKLQNALSFNYFANTQVYDPRADYISKEVPKITTKNDKGEDVTSDAPLSPTGYYIHDGQKNIANPEVTEITSEMVKDNTPALDQTKNAEVAAAAPAAEPSPTVDPVDVIKCFGYEGFFKYKSGDADLTLEISFNKTSKVQASVLPSDGKSYKAKIYVVKSDNTQQVIGGIKLSPYNANSLTFAMCPMKSNTEIDYSYDGEQTVLAVNAQSPPKFTFRPTIVDVDAWEVPMNFILSTLSAGGGKIKIEWELDGAGAPQGSFSNSAAKSFN
jgi:hypothetical protein